MILLRDRERTGATLVELLVVMSLIAALAALALMMLPSIANQDNTLKGTAEVQTALKIAQGMAGSARLPRGVRFIPQGSSFLCVEMQYLEAPPVMVSDPQVLVDQNPSKQRIPDSFRPQVVFTYTLAGVPTTSGAPQLGTITNRQCLIRLAATDSAAMASQVAQIAQGANLVLPTLGYWARINSVTSQTAGSSTFTTTSGATIQTNDSVVNLDVFPDVALGAAGILSTNPTACYQTFHFGVYGPPVPMLGEPTIPLPKNIGVDLQVSSPAGTAGTPYDILFAPSGQTITAFGAGSIGTTGSSGIYLWVRDINKVSSVAPTTTTPNWTYSSLDPFTRGGEQQIVGIRNGFVGSAPVFWPDSGLTYSGTNTPYSLAKQKLN